jgi:hypothetical protein
MERTDGLDKFKILLKIKSDEFLLDKSDKYFDKFPTLDLIRIKDSEYSKIPSEKGCFTHFNISPSKHLKGYRYILPRILRHGYFDGKNHVLPLLSFEKILFCECIEVVEHIDYCHLSNNDFKFSMHHIKSVSDLKKAILSRYKISMPNASESEIINKGVSKTTLKILDII